MCANRIGTADPIPPLTPVTSSNLAAVGYGDGCLYVQFKGKDAATPGPIWRYRGVAAGHRQTGDPVLDQILDGAHPGGHARQAHRHGFHEDIGATLR